jgi:hypothetical protein
MALKNVKEIYVIADKSNDRHYIGSTYSEYSFWGRWSQYAETGHGDTVDLKNIVNNNGIAYAQNFQFSILEIRSFITDEGEILKREKHLKDVLLTKEHGYNKN